MKSINSLIIAGKQVLPLVEGGKGISASNGVSAGAWAATGGIGTFSAAYADFYSDKGDFIPIIYHTKTRKERHEELLSYSIKAGISQAKIARDTSGGNGLINMNVLWGMAEIEKILHGILEKNKGIIDGITCGAGMPFKLAEIAAKYKVYYYPIISSARTFEILWKRAYNKFVKWLGAVVYEDPWKAGGHNGLSKAEDPEVAEDPYNRVKLLRQTMRKYNLGYVPIIMAGGVWFLREWQDWINNPELGPVMFQFGTRPLLTQESPIPMKWKKRLLTLKKGEVILNHFSPTGYYSSVVRNNFLMGLQERSKRQIPYSCTTQGEYNNCFSINERGLGFYLKDEDRQQAQLWIDKGASKIAVTPDSTLIFLTHKEFNELRKDQNDCSGCLKYCKFSGWTDNDDIKVDRVPDLRSYCIQKTLRAIAHGKNVEENLMFAGSAAYLFSQDPFYKNGFIPTVRQLIECILTGN